MKKKLLLLITIMPSIKCFSMEKEVRREIIENTGRALTFIPTAAATLFIVRTGLSTGCSALSTFACSTVPLIAREIAFRLDCSQCRRCKNKGKKKQ